MNCLIFLAQEVPSVDGLEGDTNLIWFISFVLFLLVVTNTFWVYRDKRVEAARIEERIEWEKKRDRFDEWKEAAHKKITKLALRVQTALEVWAGIESNTDLVDGDD